MPTLPSFLLHHAETIPDQTFTRVLKKGAVEKTRTFAEAWEWANGWAALFADRGLQHGDTIILALPNCDAFVGAYFGALLVGAIPAPMAPLRRAAENDPYLRLLVERVKFLGAKALVAPDETVAFLSPLLATQTPGARLISESHLDPHSSFILRPSSFNDLALLQFTSGTLGNAKAVALTHGALIAQIEMLKHSLNLYDRSKDWAVSWLPLFHDMGLIGFLLTPMVTGGEVTLLQTEEFTLRPSSWLKALTERKATITGGPPSAYALCAKRIKDAEAAQYDLSAVRIALVGAEAVTRESLSAFAEKFRPTGFHSNRFMATYGLAENALAVTMPPLDSGPEFDVVDFEGLVEGVAKNPVFSKKRGFSGDTRVFASVGAPLPEVEIAIVNDDGEPLPERHIGEVILRSPSMMSSYYHNEEATRDALRDRPSASFGFAQDRRSGERWLYTGDLGYLADGQLFITGRKKELIIVGGRNYYPDDVEQIAGAVPGARVGRAVAIGVEDAEQATERLVVLVETDKTDHAERGALKLLLRHTLIAAGYPVSDVVLLKPKSIQSTLTGKPMRVQSKARFLAGEFDNG